jgi:hypothetical protein
MTAVMMTMLMSDPSIEMGTDGRLKKIPRRLPCGVEF